MTYTHASPHFQLPSLNTTTAPESRHRVVTTRSPALPARAPACCASPPVSSSPAFSMGWPYEFVSLTPEEKHARRAVLDQYARIAHLSALAPGLLLALVLLARQSAGYIQRKRSGDGISDHGSYAEIPRSPLAKAHRLSARGSMEARWTRLTWWVRDDVQFLDTSWGQRSEWILGGSWMLWLLVLCFLQTGKDYFHLTKRFGIVAVSQMPIHYLLSLKAANPYTYLLRSSHEHLNRYHRVLGRIIYALLLLHIVFYNAYFLLASRWLARFFAPVVFCGVLASLLMHAIAVTATARLRDLSYRLFFATHLLGAFGIPLLIVFHAKSARWYVCECLLILVADLALRKTAFTSTVAAKLEAIPGTSLVKVSAPLRSEQHLDRLRATPGAHIYVSLPRAGRKASSSSAVFDILYNPFSIASVSEDGNTIHFVIRTRNGPMTRTLTDLASQQPAEIPLAIEGPYGSLRYRYADLVRSGASRVLLIAGGVGATFTLPIYHAIQNDMPTARTQLVWAIRDAGDATWAVAQSPDATAKSVLEDPNIQLYLTGDMGWSSTTVGSTAQSRSRGGRAGAVGGGGGGVEMQSMAGRGQRNRKRPDLTRIVDEAFRLSADDTVAIVVCGPKAMMADARNATQPWVMKGRRVWWHKESFGW